MIWIDIWIYLVVLRNYSVLFFYSCESDWVCVFSGAGLAGITMDGNGLEPPKNTWKIMRTNSQSSKMTKNMFRTSKINQNKPFFWLCLVADFAEIFPAFGQHGHVLQRTSAINSHRYGASSLSLGCWTIQPWHPQLTTRYMDMVYLCNLMYTYRFRNMVALRTWKIMEILTRYSRLLCPGLLFSRSRRLAWLR